MKPIILVILALISAPTAFAGTFACDLIINGERVHQAPVTTVLNEKSLVTKKASAVVYLTEKNSNEYSLEAFLPGYDARIYAEGSVKARGEKITASLWGRDILIETTCTLVK